MSDVPQKHRMRGGVRIVLILSLALNFLILGAVVGFVLVGKDRREASGGPGMRAIGLGPVMAVLAPEDRRELMDRVRAERDQLAGQSRPYGRSVQGFVASLRAEPFARDAAEVALAAQREHGTDLQAQGHALLLDQIETMSAQEREELAARIEAGLRRSVHGRGSDRANNRTREGGNERASERGIDR